MRTFNAAYGAYQFAKSVEPRYVFRVRFSDNTADDMYVRSHGDIDMSGVTGSVLTNARLSNITVTSQSLDPRQGVSRIGRMSFSGVDVNRELTDHQRQQFNSNHTARYREVEYYKGFKQLAWSEYELQATQILQGTTYRAGTYSFRCRDIQRAMREDVFEPIELRLAQPMDEETTTVELVSSTDAQGRRLAGFLHDAGFSDRPGEKVAYVKIDDEVMSVLHDDILPNQLVNVSRGALGTRPEAHTSGEQGKRLEEYIYLEGAFPRVAYGILTGFWLGQSLLEPLPEHWNAGIPGAFIRTSDFLDIGDDWITSDPAQGLPVTITDPGNTDAKRYIEREIMRIFSAFMPVYNDGALGLKRNQPTLSTAAPVGVINDSHLREGFTPTVTYAYDKVVNDLEIRYSEVDGELRRTVPLIDLESIEAHQQTPKVTFEAAALSGSRYSPVALAEIIKRFRDRYAYAPIETSVEVAANGAAYEIGDVIQLATRAIVLFTNDTVEGGILHSFEIQSVTHNLRSGTITYRLFGTSREAGELLPDFSNFAIPDGVYEQGTFGGSLPGVVDQGTSYVLPDGLGLDGEYWFDKDVLTPSGNTVFYNNTTRVWIRGVHSCFGKWDGKGRGHPGSSAVVDLSTIPILDNDQFRVQSNPPATTAGTPGFLGTTQADGGIIEFADRNSGSTSRYDYFGQSIIATITQGQYNEIPSFYVRMEGGQVVGLPADLRGTSGGGGGYRAWREDQSNIVEDNFGGDGGSGGASLVCICRGWSFGAGGELDSSGNDGQPGTINGLNEVPAWSGGGAGGAPGGTLICLDGSLSPIPQKFGHVTADYGDSPTSPGNVLDDAIVDYEDTRFGPDTVNGARVRENRVSFFESGSQNVQLGGASFRSVFVVPDLPIEGEGTDAELLLQQDIGLTVTEAYDEREDPNVTLIRAEVIRNSVTAVYSASAIYQRLAGTSNWYRMGFAEDTIDFDLPADGQEYQIQARPVLINGEESLDGAVIASFVTDSNQPSAVPDSLVAQAAVEIVALKAQVPRTLGKPDVVNVYRSTTINDPNPGFVKREPVFYVPPPADAWCTVDMTDVTVTGGTQYYYWVTAENEQGETTRYPAGSGIPATPQDNAGGAPGTPGVDGTAGDVQRLEIHRAADATLSHTTPQTMDLEFTRGNQGVIATRRITVTFNPAGIINITSAHISGEATSQVSVDPIGTRSRKIIVRHNASQATASLDVIFLTDGAPGLDPIPRGSRAGEGTADLNIAINFEADADPNNGEVSMVGHTYNANMLDGTITTVTLTALANQINTPYETGGIEPADGRGFIMWGVGSALTRFPGLYPNEEVYLKGFFVAEYETATGKWYAVGNNGARIEFTYHAEDRILFTLLKEVGSAGITGALRFVTPIPEAGVDAIPSGIRWGDGKSSIIFTRNMNADGTPNDGEIRFSAGTYTYDDALGAETSRTLVAPSQLNTFLEGAFVPPDSRAFIVHGNTPVHTRFTSITLPNAAPWASGFFVAYYDSGLWYAVNNSDQRQAFTPNDTDIVVATVFKDASATGITSISTHVPNVVDGNDGNPGADGAQGATGAQGQTGDSWSSSPGGAQQVTVTKLTTNDPPPNDEVYSQTGNDSLLVQRVFSVLLNGNPQSSHAITAEFRTDSDTWGVVTAGDADIVPAIAGQNSENATVTLTHTASGQQAEYRLQFFELGNLGLGK